MDFYEECDLVIKAKIEYLKGDIVMSELLRNEEYSNLTRFSKEFLLKLAGEEEYVAVDDKGNIVNK